MQLSVRNLSLYTCEDSVDIRNFPKITDNTLKFTGRVAKKEALDYLEKLVYHDKSHKRQILTGWISTEKGENEEILDKVADDLLQNDKAGALKYSEYAGIYFFHIKQIKNDMIQKFDIKVKEISNQLNSKPILLYAIYLRNSFNPNYYAPAIEPELIELVSVLDADDQTKIQQDIEPELQVDIIHEKEAEQEKQEKQEKQEIIDINQNLWELSQQSVTLEVQTVDKAPIIFQQEESKAAFSPVTSDEDVNFIFNSLTDLFFNS